MDQMLENRTIDEIKVGETASLERVLTQRDIQLFAVVSGNINPLHVDQDFLSTTGAAQFVGHSMWGASLVSALLGTKLPGPGTTYLSQNLSFNGSVHLGDRLHVEVCVREKDIANQQVTLDCYATNQEGREVFRGNATVKAPTDKIRRAAIHLPNVELHDPYRHYRQLIALTTGKPAVRTAVVHPTDDVSLGGALEAMQENLIIPVLVGPLAKIQATAEKMGADLSGIEIIDAPHSHAAAIKAAELARTNVVQMLMKGSLHTDELMHAVVAREGGLRTGRRITHVFAMDVPEYSKPLFITDAAINIQPDLITKTDIVQNAIDFVHILGIHSPKVAILSAVETINQAIPSTLDAAALCKMADRGQITGGIIDGPMAFDNAISAHAAQIKHMTSPVSGEVDILVVPDLESGNMLFKQLVYLADALAAGIVLGAKVPIVLTSRADSELARKASSALGMLVANHNTQRAL
ncbi:bifunctional enoyl-CoA hydratase/phosphate acetyltransferase [Tengunoibacter tsumagoiensis]|uniref:Phosphate acetyltransferase n=1 Tax=Tengunoibacter tsumagoiensis TaxID=2014871 RepID=A0A402A6U3_9CHLR|nr:bifunctional enoyl-CoA hydratase/phosphate acetyltransferase [Tengunoibacter tsumagoiensis]GCE14746.1 phosphate acetyltransferase [Tengunoibacter tsumagoiensis]